MKKKGSSSIAYIIAIAVLIAAALICLLAFADGRFGNLFNRGRSASAETSSEDISFSESAPEYISSAEEAVSEPDGAADSNTEESSGSVEAADAGKDASEPKGSQPENSSEASSKSSSEQPGVPSAEPEKEGSGSSDPGLPAAKPTEPPTETPTPEPVINTDASGRVIPAEGEYLFDLETIEAATPVDVSLLDQENPDKYFRSYEISDALFERIYGDDRSFKTYCTVPREHLRYIKVLYHDFEGQVRVGEIMVNYLVADDIVYIFEELYKIGYQFQLIVLVDDFGANDDISILHNNTSAFNYRNVTGGDYPSNHAYGTAIDINPYNNPYVMYDADGNPSWLDEGAGNYLDREAEDAYERHMINHSDPCFQLFAERGWAWGGDWTGIIDYQHFEKVIYP